MEILFVRLAKTSGVLLVAVGFVWWAIWAPSAPPFPHCTRPEIALQKPFQQFNAVGVSRPIWQAEATVTLGGCDGELLALSQTANLTVRASCSTRDTVLDPHPSVVCDHLLVRDSQHIDLTMAVPAKMLPSITWMIQQTAELPTLTPRDGW